MGKNAKLFEQRVVVLLVISACMGVAICYVGIECQRAMSTTSFFVLQNVTKVFVVACGIFVFGDSVNATSSIFGLLLSLGGSVLYSRSHLSHQHEKQHVEANSQTTAKTPGTSYLSTLL